MHSAPARPSLSMATKKKKPPATKARKRSAPIATFTVKALDPLAKCGPGTTVQALYRLDETFEDGKSVSHLVFYDRHGWYCQQHGVDCPAVPHSVTAFKKTNSKAR